MNQDVKDFTVQKVKEFMSVPYCCAEAKEAGQAFLDALGTEQEAEKAKALIAELRFSFFNMRASCFLLIRTKNLNNLYYNHMSELDREYPIL